MFPNVQQLALMLASQEGGAPTSGGCAENNPILLPVIMIAILYVVWILPSQKERKKHATMLDALKRGDEVITNAGIIGTITDIAEKIYTLEIAKGVKIRVLKSSIAKRMEDVKEPAKPDDKGKTDASKTSSNESKAPKS